jgi:flagellar biosynthesis component FlhA
MRFANPDAPLAAAVLPIAAIGLLPLAILPLAGYFGFVALGILIGFAAVMAQLEEQGAHARQVIAHGSMARAEQAGYRAEMSSLMRSLWLAKILAVGLVIFGFGGLLLSA